MGLLETQTFHRGRWTGWLSPDGAFYMLSQDDRTHNGFIENDAVRAEDGETSLLGMDFDAFAQWSHRCDTNGADYFAETACRLGWVVVRQENTTIYLENFWKPINRKQREWAEDRRADGFTTLLVRRMSDRGRDLGEAFRLT